MSRIPIIVFNSRPSFVSRVKLFELKKVIFKIKIEKASTYYEIQKDVLLKLIIF